MKSNTVTAIEALHYALNTPSSVVINGMDSMERVDQALEAVRTFKPFTQDQLAALLKKTEKAAAKGEFELFKTSSVYDSTAENTAWLGSEPERVKSRALVG